MKKLICLLCAAAMCLGMLAGCGTEAPSAPDSAPAPAEPTQAPAETPAPIADGSAEAPASVEAPPVVESIFPLEETETLSLYYPWSPRFVELGYDSPNDFKFFSELENRTNVHIDFTAVGADIFSENFLLMMATQDYTDMYFNCTANYSGGISKAIEDGAWLDLSEMMDRLAPNYTALMDADPDFYRANHTDEGAVGQFMQYYENSFNQNGLVIRKDWLDAVEQDVPVTYDQWYDALCAIKNQYGLSNTLITGAPESGFYNQTENGFVVKDGTVTCVWTDEAMAKPWLEISKKWYEAGLFTSSALVKNGIPDQEGRSMVLSSEVAVFSVDIDLFPIYEEQLRDSGYVGTAVSRPVVNEGDTPYDAMQTIYGHGITISSACADPELAVQWVDNFYTEDIELLANYGTEGETFTYDADGVPHFTDMVLNDEDGLNFALFKYVVDWGPTVLDWNRKLDSYTEEQLHTIDVWSDVDSSMVYPTFATFTTEESAVISEHYTDISTLVQEFQPKLIMGEMNLADFDEFVQMLEDAGLSEVTECYQNAYDRYMNR